MMAIGSRNCAVFRTLPASRSARRLLGVALDAGTFVTTGPVSAYEYVDVNGNLVIINATSAVQAFSLATNIAPHSGVMAI